MVTETRTEHPHIVRVKRPAGEEAVVKGTRLAVWFIVRQLRAGDTPEKLVAGYPNLSLASVHSAMSYYYDHKAEVDAIINDLDPLASHDPVEEAR